MLKRRWLLLAPRSCPPLSPASPARRVPQDHPDDRAWLKHVFDFVTEGVDSLPQEKVGDLLQCFYRNRSEGPTQSGSYLYQFPENEYTFLCALYEDGARAINFATLMDALMAAQGALPSASV